MPFDINAASDRCAAWVVKSTLLRAGARNPFVTALLITALVFAILYALMGPALRDTRWQLVLRGGIYALIAVTLVMLVHNYVTSCDLRERTRDAASANILAGVEANLGDVPVVVQGRGEPRPRSAAWGGGSAAENLIPRAVGPPSSYASSSAASSVSSRGAPLPAITPIVLPPLSGGV